MGRVVGLLGVGSLVVGALVAGGCGPDSPAPVAKDPGASAPPLDAVLLVTLDAMNARFYGDYNGWSVTPALDAFLAEAVVLPDTYTVRGLTSVALASLHTGSYPRRTAIRNNDDEALAGGPDLFAVFHDAGWQTLGMSANQCSAMDYAPDAVDIRRCYSATEHPELTQSEADTRLVDELLEALDAREPAQPVFARLHLANPHWPYTPVEPWLTEFHPEPWTGEWDPALPAALIEKMLAAEPITEAERTYLHAVYASQVRATDALLGQLFDGLRATGLDDNVLIVFGSDHGDELAIRTNFMYHGCSPYNTVLGALYAFKAPGLAPATIDGAVSIVDIAPTVLELARVDPPGGQDGTSLVETLSTGIAPARPVFFERSPETAGIIEGNQKLILSPYGDFDQCAPYNTAAGQAYPNDPVEIYDLLEDPDERVNRAGTPTATTEALQDRLCGWVTEDLWGATPEADDRNRLVVQCRQRLGIPTGPIDSGALDSGGDSGE